VFGAPTRILGILPLSFFRTYFCFNLSSYARFQFGPLADSGFRSESGFFFRLPARQGLSLAAGLFLSNQTRRFLGLAANRFVGPTLGLRFGETASLFGRESLGFLLRATASVFFGSPTCFILGAPSLLGFGTHLGFDFSTQTGFFFSPAQCFGFSLTARVLFGSSTSDIFRQSLRFGYGPHARVVTGLHSCDLFFHRPESHLGATAQFIFLGFLSGFTFQIMPLVFGTMPGIFFFGLPQNHQFSLMRRLGSLPLTVDFGAARFLHCAHAHQLFFRSPQFMCGDLAVMFFFGLLARFDLDALLFLLGALTRGFLFLLTPAFLFKAQRIFGG
jgi:hypothetical protein